MKNTTMADARMNCPAHNGVTQDIREALKRAGVPLSPYKLSLLCGRKPEQIKSALGQLIRGGGIMSVPGPKCVLYTFYKPTPRRPRTGRDEHLVPAGPITIGRGSRWGSAPV